MFYLRKPLHPTWIFTVLCGSVVAGITMSPILPSGLFGQFQYFMIAMIGIGWGFYKRRRYVILPVILFGLLLGVWRGSLERQALDPVAYCIGKSVKVVGVVSDDIDVGKKGEMVIRLGDLNLNGQEIPGSIWVSVNGEANVRRSDTLEVKGKLSEGFGSFSASMYRGEIVKIDRPSPGDIALDMRDGFAENVRKAVNEPMASLGLGYLVGQRRALPADLDEALKVAGLTHIVVASGYNLTILVRFARRYFEKISKYLATIIPAGLVLVFMAVTGMSPSMSRAGFVSLLSLAAWYFGRKFHPVTLLLFAAAVTTSINPQYAWGDLGWQLSFAAFGGVMIIAPLLQAYFFGEKKPGAIRQVLGETFSAQIATAPIIIFAFGTFSLVAILSNMLILPLVPLAMLLTFAAGIGAILFPSAAGIVGWPADVLLNYMVETARWSADLPWAQLKIEIPIQVVVLVYGVMILACIYMLRVTKLHLRNSQIVE